MTAIRITLADQTCTAQLDDNATARDLVGALPLTLTFSDSGGVEKVTKLPRPLDTTGAPAGAAPDIHGIGYYAPLGNLVFYYRDVGYWEGIVPLGRFDEDIDFMQSQPDGFEVTIGRA